MTARHANSEMAALNWRNKGMNSELKMYVWKNICANVIMEFTVEDEISKEQHEQEVQSK